MGLGVLFPTSLFMYVKLFQSWGGGGGGGGGVKNAYELLTLNKSS